MAFSRRFDGPEPERLNRWLAQAGVCSRREAEALIAAGQVFIDGARVEEPGRKIAPGQTLVIAEAGAQRLEQGVTIVIHKPVGYVSAQPEPGQIPAARLILPAGRWPEPGPAPRRDHTLAPLGRLDQDSRGLLLLSDDGVLAKAVIGPASQLSKRYEVAVRGAITPRALSLLRHGLSLDGRALRPAQVHRMGDRLLEFVLREGRNRQIRRMCELVGLEVVDLLRTHIGGLSLGPLPEGRWAPLARSARDALIADSRAKG